MSDLSKAIHAHPTAAHIAADLFAHMLDGLALAPDAKEVALGLIASLRATADATPIAAVAAPAPTARKTAKRK